MSPDDPRVLRDRGKALEDEFFRRQSEDHRAKLREQETLGQRREALKHVAVITDDATIDRILDLGITAETWAAVSLVPLVEVAWANGQVEEQERRSVLAAAEANGVTPGSPSYALLDSWLAHRPDGRLMGTWAAYIAMLSAELSPAEKHALRDELMSRARHVAEAAGGFLGLGNKVSAEEKVILEELGKAFDA
ncbi:MAG: hypothetical protein VX546_12960 [Myxococcota bacterium]|nr:hypothetical protein [Myxococcota bacterium]